MELAREPTAPIFLILDFLSIGVFIKIIRLKYEKFLHECGICTKMNVGYKNDRSLVDFTLILLDMMVQILFNTIY